MAVAETILTSEFFYQFASQYGEDEPVRAFILEYDVELHKHVVINYKGLGFMEDLYAEQTIANAVYAFSLMGDNIKRIYDALVTDYNPLENYFTDRTEETGKEGSNVKSGSKTTTPTGSVSSQMNGTRNRTYNNYGSESAATTFDNPGTVAQPNYSPTTSNKQNGTINDGFTNYGTTTSYNQYSVTETYNDITDAQESTEGVEEHRSGNSGIFSKQDLTQRELALRETNMFIKTFVRMLVDAFNKGVW